MATDVVPGLNEAIQTSFKSNVMKDRRIATITKRIRDGTATLDDAHDYSWRLGENLSKALRDNLTADTLPDGRLYYNIAKRTVTPALEENYELTNEIATEVQALLDAQAQIGLNAVKADFPKERIQGLIDKMTADGISLEEALIWLGEPIINNCEAFFDDFVDSNAKFRQSVGLSAKLIRKAEPGACEWCRALVGEFDYGDAPDDIYRRHEFCRCSVVYESKKERQDVWSKRIWQTSEEDLARRKDTGQKTEISPQERIEASNRVYRDTVLAERLKLSNEKRAGADNNVSEFIVYERRRTSLREFKKMSPEERVSLYDQALQRRAQGKG